MTTKQSNDAHLLSILREFFTDHARQIVPTDDKLRRTHYYAVADESYQAGRASRDADVADLLAACKARVRLSTSAPVKDRWQVVIGGAVESGHESRQLARKRIDAIRTAAIARAEGGGE